MRYHYVAWIIIESIKISINDRDLFHRLLDYVYYVLT